LPHTHRLGRPRYDCFLCDRCGAPYHANCLPPHDLLACGTPNASDAWLCPLCLLITRSRLPLTPTVHSYKYLGLPIGLHTTTTSIFAAPLAKFEARVASLVPLHTSFSTPERITIANTYLLPIFSYVCQVYIPPAHLINRIQSLLAGWFRNQGRFKISLLTRPRTHLGLKTPLKDFQLHSLALLLSSAGAARNNPIATAPQQTRPKPPRDCAPRSHLIAAHAMYHHLTASSGSWPLPDALNRDPNSAQSIYKSLTLGPTHTRHNNQLLRDTIHSLFSRYAATETASDSINLCLTNLLDNYTQLPPALPDHLRWDFILLIHNALAFHDRIRHWRGNGDQANHTCPFCQEPHEDLAHALFTCRVSLAARARLADIAPSLNQPTLTRALLMEPLHHYYELSGLPPSDSAPFYHATGPVLLFALAIWRARKSMLTLNPPHPGDEYATRTITHSFWNLCTSYPNARAAFPAFTNTITDYPSLAMLDKPD